MDYTNTKVEKFEIEPYDDYDRRKSNDSDYNID